MSNRPRILFLRPIFGIGASFVRVDQELLGRHLELTPMAADLTDHLFPARLLKAALTHDLCFVWFADAHAYHAVNAFRLVGKPVVIVPGQYELACAPEGNYGLQLENRKRWRRGILALKRAAAVLAVSDFHGELLSSVGVPTERLQRIYHGFEMAAFRPGHAQENIVITVTHFRDRQRIWHKGLEAFAEAAALVPEARFVIAGDYSPENAEYLQGLAHGRLELTGSLSQDEVASLLGRAKVYAQLSATETFGCALAEAMLCGCIPVVTNRGSLPEVAGDLGQCVEYGDANGTAAAVRKALQANHGAACRERIIRLFSVEQREKALVEVIAKLVER
jgi:glycosyltransferase involved in cell wall biosynthesis